MAFSALLEMADRAALSILGGAVQYRPTVGEPVDVAGIFDAAYVRAEVGDAGVSSSQPAVFLRESDLPFNPDEDTDPTILVAGEAYVVREVKRDGMGGVVLLMHRA
jgi:hypothetical protein